MQQLLLLCVGIVLATLIATSSAADARYACDERRYDQESFVCVCRAVFFNASCDAVEPLGTLTAGGVVYATGRDRNRLTRSSVAFSKLQDGAARVRLFPNRRYQKIIGFGGAITDAALISLTSLNSEALQQKLVAQYFGLDGAEYSLARVPIASSDFSTRDYSYLENDQDFGLDFFRLVPEDIPKIAFIKSVNEAQRKTGSRPLRLFATPWSPPGWMKKNGAMKGGAELREKFNGVYYLTWARYIIRFFVDYAKSGIQFWGLTVQNEPSSGCDPDWRWQTLCLNSTQQRDFIRYRLGPLMKQNWVTKDIKIMAHDDQRDELYAAAQEIYNEKETYVDGLAVHWYSRTTYEPLNQTFHLRPDKFILATEACNAYGATDHVPLLGSWQYAENYAHDILQDLRNYASGWTDWNLFLNELGGPNWVGNFVDAPIIVNATGIEFYKQPTYYVLGHFSKFLPPDSQRVDVKVDGFEGTENDELEAVAFETPDAHFVTIIHNRDAKRTFELAVGVDGESERTINVKLEPKSLRTIVWAAASAPKKQQQRSQEFF